VTRGEGNTWLYEAPTIAERVGLDRLQLKHEGENPTASFKDRGMTVAISVARRLGLSRVACASTGNTSASMAGYAARAGMEALVFVPDGEIAYGKLSQALAYGGRTLQLAGDFDDAMRLVEEVCASEGIYLVNSVNPFRIEGQKAIGFELLQDLGWEVPDWIVLPGGNLGNNTAIAKGLIELKTIGLIDRLPRIAVIQAAGANPLYTAWSTGEPIEPVKADTLASAIKI
jgi:threonine synthase